MVHEDYSNSMRLYITKAISSSEVGHSDQAEKLTQTQNKTGKGYLRKLACLWVEVCQFFESEV
jgi:hypothetical protein